MLIECGVFLLYNKARKEAVASFLVWSHKVLNIGPPDYESGATNQLSYGTNFCVFQAICGVRTALQLAVKTHKFKEL